MLRVRTLLTLTVVGASSVRVDAAGDACPDEPGHVLERTGSMISRDCFAIAMGGSPVNEVPSVDHAAVTGVAGDQ